MEGVVGLIITPLLMAYSVSISAWNKEGVGTATVFPIVLAWHELISLNIGLLWSISHVNAMFS